MKISIQKNSYSLIKLAVNLGHNKKQKKNVLLLSKLPGNFKHAGISVTENPGINLVTPTCIRRRNKECLPFNTTLVLRGLFPDFQ